MRLVVTNVLYPPQAFGGATIVADQTSQLIAAAGDEVLVITSDQSGQQFPGSLKRYDWCGVPVIRVAIDPAYGSAYRNELFAARFADICDAFRPDAVLTHAIQGIGASYLEWCETADIPFVVFVHDAWWLCERQFMTNRSGVYCHQKAVDKSVCQYCVDDPRSTRLRDTYLRQRLSNAAAVLFPSAFMRDLYVASGVSAETCYVVKNGVKEPRVTQRYGQAERYRRRRERVRFGFVGGVGPIKGSENIRQIFSTLERTDYSLVCVDNVANLGVQSYQFRDWNISGNLRVRPAYTQDTIDEFFQSIDVLLFPSQCKESFGLAVREALIRHKWAIVTDGGGTTEDIVDGENGEIIPIGPDVEPLRQAILKCFNREWGAYRNPYSSSVMTFAQQAANVRSRIQEVLQTRQVREGYVNG